MLFESNINSTLWDVWLYYEDGIHYLFYLANSRPDRPWDGIGLATSKNGVHFDDHGMIVTKAPDAEYLGAGHTWKAGDKYVLNFSESRNGNLEIFFAESDDLMNWKKISPEESTSRADSQWYSDATEISQQRWDNIWVNPDSEGHGYYGYVTAVAKEGPAGLRGTCASVRSEDGVVFTTGAPVIDPGFWPDRLEIGGVEKIDGNYYMFAALAEIPAGLDWAKHHSQAVGGVYVARADRQEGPFELDPRQKPVLVSSMGHHTYFARFYRAGDEMLVAHHSLEQKGFIATVQPKMNTWMAPLKKARVEDGVLSLEWWQGNEAIFGKELASAVDDVQMRLAESHEIDRNSGSITFEGPLYSHAALPYRYDFEKGLVIEASLSMQNYDSERPCGMGVFLEGSHSWTGTNILIDSTGKFSMGPTNGYSFWDEEGHEAVISSSTSADFRVLVRGTFVEVYINDALIQCYSLPEVPKGRVGFVATAGTVTATKIRIREMEL